jgi:hypothetical protein
MQASRRTFRSALVLICALLPLACGDPPVRVDRHEGLDSTTTTTSTDEEDPVALFFGEVRLTGKLAQIDQGTVFVYARQPGTRIPTLIQHLNVPEFKVDGDAKVHSYELTDAHTMGGMSVEIPENLELKIYYDPDGMVDTREGQEEIVLQTTPGQKRYDAELHDGMATSDDVPSAFPGEEE